MRVSTAYRQAYSDPAARYGIARVKLFDALATLLRKEGVILRGQHSLQHHVKTTLLDWGAKRGLYDGAFHSLFYRLVQDNSFVPHWDKLVEMTDAIFSEFQELELHSGTLHFDNLLILLAKQINRVGWEPEEVKQVVREELSALLENKRVFIPKGAKYFPPHLKTPAEEKKLKDRAVLPAEHYAAMRELSGILEREAPPTAEEVSRLMSFQIRGQGSLGLVFSLLIKHQTAEMRLLLRKALLAARVLDFTIGEDFGDGENLFSAETQETIREYNRAAGDSSDDPYQPWRTPGISLRDELLKNVFGRKLAPVYFETYWLSKLLSYPGGNLDNQAMVAQQWSGGGIFERGDTPGSYFRISVHNGPNKRDMRFLEAIVQWWDQGDDRALRQLRETGQAPAEVWVEPPEKVNATEKAFARQLLGLMKAHYQFSATLTAKDFSFVFPAAEEKHRLFREESALTRFATLTGARKELFAQMSDLSARRSQAAEIIGVEHKICEAALLNAVEVTGDDLDSVDKNNLHQAVDFMRALVEHLRYSGFEVSRLDPLLEKYAALLKETDLHYQGLYVLNAQLQAEIAAVIGDFEEDFDQIYAKIIETKEWKKIETEKVFHDFKDSLLRRGFFNPLLTAMERIQAHFSAELQARGIDPGELTTSEVEEISDLRLAFYSPLPRAVFHLYRSELPEGALAGKLALGNKGYSLALAWANGLPVPRAFMFPWDLAPDLAAELRQLEAGTGKVFGDPRNPLLVSVRPSAPLVIPGAMDTVLNVGIDHDVADNLGRSFGRAFAYSTFMNFVLSFGVAALKLDKNEAEALMRRGKQLIGEGGNNDQFFFKDLPHRVQDLTKGIIPWHSLSQLSASIDGARASYHSKAAFDHRVLYGVPDDWGMAILVQAMVFGNLNERSGSYSLSSHEPISGRRKLSGDLLVAAQGTEIMSGQGRVSSFSGVSAILSPLVDQGVRIVRGPVQAEVTVEDDRPYVLQLKEDSLSPEATLMAQIGLVEAGIRDKREAVLSVRQVWKQLFFPRFSRKQRKRPIAQGIAASAGAVTGRIVFSLEKARQIRAEGAKPILVVPYLTNEGEKDLAVVGGILTQKGGIGSHAASIARKINRPCVAGCDELEFGEGKVKIGNQELKEGEWLSLDGSAGEIMAGKVPLVRSEIATVLAGRKKPAESAVFRAYLTIQEWASELRIKLNS